MKNKSRAWRTEGGDGIVSITFATTRNKAKYNTYLSAQEVGHALSLTKIKIKRAPEYDGCSFNFNLNRTCYIEEYLKEELRRGNDAIAE